MANQTRIKQAQLDGAAVEVAAPAAQSGDTIPAGFVALYAGITPPAGWATADGSEISRAEYPSYAANMAAASYPWGSGDGTKTVNLPDLRDKIPVGASGTKVLGSGGGAETHAVTTAELPVHNHGGATGTGTSSTRPAHNHGLTTTLYQQDANAGTTRMSNTQGSYSTADPGNHTHSVPSLSISSQGGGTAMSLMQPYKAVHYIVRIY